MCRELASREAKFSKRLSCCASVQIWCGHESRTLFLDFFDQYGKSPEPCSLVKSSFVTSHQPLEIVMCVRLCFFRTVLSVNPNVEPRGRFPQALVRKRCCAPGSLLHSTTRWCTKQNRSGNKSGTSRCILTGTEISQEPCCCFFFLIDWCGKGRVPCVWILTRTEKVNAPDMKSQTMHTKVNVSAPKLRSMH